MNERDVIRRIRAYQAGEALPLGSTRRVAVASAEDLLIVAFVRMGGESRPWGIAYGHEGTEPTVATVPEPRNRDLVAAMVAEFSVPLLEHFRCPAWSFPEPDGWEDLVPLRQLWLPNPTHLAMLHQLAYAYAFTTHGGRNRDILNAAGRLASWLFREANRPGQMVTMVATAALRGAWTFPAQDVRQGHLAYLLAWLVGDGTREVRLEEAAIAEQLPIATSLDPDMERHPLASLVDDWNESERVGAHTRSRDRAEQVHEILAPELLRRWELTSVAVAALRDDPRPLNAGVSALEAASVKEQWYQHIRLELSVDDQADGPSRSVPVETDRHPAAAAARYFVQSASADLVNSLLVHDDDEAFADLVAEGTALRGQIVSVEDEGEGRKARPVWVVRDTADRQLRVHVGNELAVRRLPNRVGRVRRIEQVLDGAIDIEIEITKLVGRRSEAAGSQSLRPTDAALVGTEVDLVPVPKDGISRTKSFAVWNDEGPGAWLTHQRPGGIGAVVPPEEMDDMAVNDLTDGAPAPTASATGTQ